MPDHNVKFDHFDLSYEAYLTGLYPTVPAGLSSEQYYDYMIRRIRQDPRLWAHTGFGFVIERGWYAQNRPEFKVYPGIMAALENTHVEIDAKFFKMPFSAFMIRFPHHFLREDENSPYVRAMIATIVREPVTSRTIMVDDAPMGISDSGAPEVDKLVIYVCFDTDEPFFNFFKFPLIHGATIQNTFDTTTMRSDGESVKDVPEYARDGYWPSRKLYGRLLQIVVGTAFFGIGRDRQKKNQVVEEDQLPRHERRRIAKETGERTRDVKRPSFVVGRDIELPRFEPETREPTEVHPDSECASCGDPFKLHSGHSGKRHACIAPECQCLEWNSGRHISYGYIRCGHLHYYCVGKRKGLQPGEELSYELRWVDPHAVRADLPFGPPKARAVKEPKNPIVSADITRLQNP